MEKLCQVRKHTSTTLFDWLSHTPLGINWNTTICFVLWCVRFKVIWLHSNNGNCFSAEKTQKKTHWTFGRIASATAGFDHESTDGCGVEWAHDKNSNDSLVFVRGDSESDRDYSQPLINLEQRPRPASSPQTLCPWLYKQYWLRLSNRGSLHTPGPLHYLISARLPSTKSDLINELTLSQRSHPALDFFPLIWAQWSTNAKLFFYSYL